MATLYAGNSVVKIYLIAIDIGVPVDRRFSCQIGL